MKTVTLEVRSPEEGMKEFVQTWRSGRAQRSVRIGFATPELLWKVLSAKRWELLKALVAPGRSPYAKRHVGVQRDVTALLSAGLLNRTKTGNIEFPYEAIKVEFLLHAA
jgi:hypothetical protein